MVISSSFPFSLVLSQMKFVKTSVQPVKALTPSETNIHSLFLIRSYNTLLISCQEAPLGGHC